MQGRVGKGPRVVNSERRKPLWLYPNLLSLDAPLVSVAWMHVFAETWGVRFIPWQAYVALGLVVWMIYVTDRIIDAALPGQDGEGLSARHEFHRRHRKWFFIGLMAAVVVVPFLVFSSLPIMIINFALAGGILVAAYFILTLYPSEGSGDFLQPKNVLGGLSFAYGTALLAHLYSGSGIGFARVGVWEMTVGAIDMLRSRELLLFVFLCVFNISAVDWWERRGRSRERGARAADEVPMVLPLIMVAGAAVVFALLEPEMSNRPFFYAILTGAALLYMLNRRREEFSTDALRVLADVSLLVPVVVFLAFPRG
jgi:hypothetical protein